MNTVVDTSAILALLYPDDEHNERATELLQDASEAGRLAINPVVYAEVAGDSTFDSREELDYFLSDTGIAIDSIEDAVAFRAGESFSTYLSRRGDTLECPSCGRETTVECQDCERELSARQHTAADFLIGAHGESADRLLTFDGGFYRDYFDVDIQSVSK